jgi:uncharacterized membrane protein
MSWSARFRLRQYLKGSLWFVPLLGGVAGWLAGSTGTFLHRDVSLQWDYSQSTATTVLTTIVGATAALTGFVVTVTVLVVQMATGTFSARYMRLWYRDRMLKALLAMLVGTLTLSFTLLRRVESDAVPNVGVTIAGTLLVLSLLLFLLFFDRFIHRLRPVAVAALVSRQGRRQLVAAAGALGAAEGEPSAPADAPALVVRAGRSGAVQAIDARGLVRWAERHDCVLRLPHAVGDYVSAATPVIAVHGRVDDPARAERDLRGMTALGIERTIDQDPAFAIRILVDIAIKALSPAVNDPTTAVQALNHLGDLLHALGDAGLADRAELRDAGGRVRLVLATRSWADHLALAVTEIRIYGRGAIQVVRRLRALLEDLLETVRPEHRAAVEEELARLDESVGESFGASVDLDRALVPDRQGIGGPSAVVAAAAGRQTP